MNTSQKLVSYWGYTCVIEKYTHTLNGQIALRLIVADTPSNAGKICVPGYELARVTTRFANVHVDANKTIINNRDNNPDMLDVLIRGGIVEKPEGFIDGYPVVAVLI
jgi:hypothetical protein